MTKNELNKKVNDLRELKRMSKELDEEITALETAIKAEMKEQNTDTLTGDDWKVTWKPVTSNKFDTTAFKASNPGVYEMYLKASTSMRFLVNNI